MDEETKVKQGKETKIKKRADKNEIQITISIESEQKLKVKQREINEGFRLGRVTRKDLAVYLIEKALSTYSDADTQAIREGALTDLALLDKLYRDAKASGQVPEALREFLWKSMNLKHAPKKVKKPRQNNNSNATHIEEGVA